MYYTINLYDGTPIKVQLEVYLDMNYMYWADVAMYVTGGIVFLLLLLLMIHHKICYINRLESELKILGGGNWNIRSRSKETKRSPVWQKELRH